MKRVIGYIRVSTNHQDLERQKDLIRHFCQEKGHTLLYLIEDFGLSGAENSRPGYMQLQSLEEDTCDTIVVSELSRLSRNEDVMATLNTIYALIAKFDLILLDDLSSTYRKGSRFDFLQFIGLAFKAYGAADERKKIAERMKTGKYSIISRHPMACLDGNNIYGFQRVRHPEFKERCKGVPQFIYVIHPTEARVVQSIFRMVQEGMSINGIATRLNDKGIHSPKEKEVSTTFVRNILHRSIYKGTRLYKGTEYQTGTEIVPPELWHNAQLILKSNALRADRYTVHPNPLKGILKCGCGNNMQIVQTEDRHNYVCVSKRGNKCSFHGISAKYLVAILWYDARQKISHKEEKEMTSSRILALRTEIQELEEGIRIKNTDISSIKEAQNITIENIATSTNSNVIAALNQKVDEMDRHLELLVSSIDAIRKKIARAKRKLKAESKALSEKGLCDLTTEGKAEVFRNMYDRVEWISEKRKIGFLVVTDKKQSQHIYIYKNINSLTRCIVLLPSFFVYNRLDRTVKISKDSYYFHLQRETKAKVRISSLTGLSPEEILRHFNLTGNKKYDLTFIFQEDQHGK